MVGGSSGEGSAYKAGAAGDSCRKSTMLGDPWRGMALPVSALLPRKFRG